MREWNSFHIDIRNLDGHKAERRYHLPRICKINSYLLLVFWAYLD